MENGAEKAVQSRDTAKSLFDDHRKAVLQLQTQNDSTKLSVDVFRTHFIQWKLPPTQKSGGHGSFVCRRDSKRLRTQPKVPTQNSKRCPSWLSLLTSLFGQDNVIPRLTQSVSTLFVHRKQNSLVRCFACARPVRFLSDPLDSLKRSQ